MSKGRYYLYQHIRLDKNEIFYIGIGTKSKYKNFKSYETEYRRAYTHERRNIYWKRIVNKASYKIEILLESNDYNFIKQQEIEHIAKYQRVADGGILCNITLGGDGTHGFNRTPEINKHIAEQITGVYNKRSKKAYQYNKLGYLINEFDSFNLAAKSQNLIKQNILHAKDKSGLCGGYYWSDIKYKNILEESIQHKLNLSKDKNKYTRKIIAEKNSEKLEFDSIVLAALYFTGSKNNKSNIKKVLSGKISKSYGYSFSYKNAR